MSRLAREAGTCAAINSVLCDYCSPSQLLTTTRVLHGCRGQIALNCLGRPVRLWLQLPVQLLARHASLPHTEQLCHSPVFQHPAAQQLFSGAYSALRCLLFFCPLPVSLMVEHGLLGRCQCVLRMTQLTFGFWLPMAVAAVQESRAYRQWQREAAVAGRLSPAGGADAGVDIGGSGRGSTGGPPLGWRLEERVYAMVNDMADGIDMTVWVMVSLVLASTWDVLAAKTPA